MVRQESKTDQVLARAAARDGDRGVRRRLAAHTRAHHLALHASPAFAKLMRGTLDQAGYADLLGRLYRVHAAAEAQIAVFDDHPALAWRRSDVRDRAGMLRLDLASLGHRQVVAWPGRMELRFDNAFAALGGAWVIEGSALGGRVMAPLAGKVAGMSGAVRFFSGAGDQAARWAACCSALEIFGQDDRTYAHMESAAIATFDVFASLLC